MPGVELAVYPFMGIHFWGFRTEQLLYLAYVGLFAFPVSYALTPVATRLLDKRLTVMIALAVSIIAMNVPICLRQLEASWFPDNESSWILTFFLTYAIIAALASPLRTASANSMPAHVIAERELETGIGREGVVYAVRAFSMKATSEFGRHFGGVLLSATDFPVNAAHGGLSAEMTWNLGFVMAPATSICSLAAILFYLRYRIDKRRHSEIMAGIERRGWGQVQRCAHPR